MRPQTTLIVSEREARYAYLRLHAEYIYDELKASGSGSTDFAFVVEEFGTEFSEASDREDFSKRIRKRLEEEQYQGSSADSYQLLKQYLSSDQLDSIDRCLQGGSLVYTIQSLPGAETLAVRVTFMGDRSFETGQLKTRVSGGTLDGLEATQEVGDYFETTFFVKPTGDAADVVIAGDVDGLWTDSISGVRSSVKCQQGSRPALDFGTPGRVPGIEGPDFQNVRRLDAGARSTEFPSTIGVLPTEVPTRLQEKDDWTVSTVHLPDGYSQLDMPMLGSDPISKPSDAVMLVQLACLSTGESRGHYAFRAGIAGQQTPGIVSIEDCGMPALNIYANGPAVSARHGVYVGDAMVSCPSS